jgi:putative acetyltransferase
MARLTRRPVRRKKAAVGPPAHAIPAAPLRRIEGPFAADSEFITRLVAVFRDARRARLPFTLDLHDAHEDRHYLSGTVLPNNQVWVAESDGRAVAFIAFAPGWVNHLYVAPDHQRRGLGRRLLDVAKASSASLELWAFEANGPAIAFYEREGFRVVERTDGAANEARMPDVRMRWPEGGATQRPALRTE